MSAAATKVRASVRVRPLQSLFDIVIVVVKRTSSIPYLSQRFPASHSHFSLWSLERRRREPPLFLVPPSLPSVLHYINLLHGLFFGSHCTVLHRMACATLCVTRPSIRRRRRRAEGGGRRPRYISGWPLPLSLPPSLPPSLSLSLFFLVDVVAHCSQKVGRSAKRRGGGDGRAAAVASK